MHEGKYAIICIFKYAEICTKYAAICSTKYAGICTNKQTRNMQYMCIISINMQKICKNKISIYMHIYHKQKYAPNMHKYAKPNMHKYAVSKYAQKCVLYAQIYAKYAKICTRINMPLYANLNMHEICKKYAVTHKYFSYAFICTYMHKVCKNRQDM